jgi:hypothetical protein
MKDSFEDVFGYKRVHCNETCQLCWDKTLPEILKSLQERYDTTIGLWCTDKPELIPENIKHLFHRLEPIARVEND